MISGKERKEIEVYEDYDGDDERGAPVILKWYYCPYCHARIDRDRDITKTFRCPKCHENFINPYLKKEFDPYFLWKAHTYLKNKLDALDMSKDSEEQEILHFCYVEIENKINQTTKENNK